MKLPILFIAVALIIIGLIACDDTVDKSFMDPVYIDPTDVTPPTVSFTTLVDSASVPRAIVAIDITANDDKGIQVVELRVDTKLISEDRTAPYVLEWNTNTSEFSSGTWHEVCVQAHDNGGNQAYTCIQVQIQ